MKTLENNGQDSKTAKTTAKAETKPVALYGKPEFSIPDNAKVNLGRRGDKNTLCIAVKTPVPALGLVIESAIWASMEQKSDGNDITIAASLPRGLRPFGSADEQQFARDSFLAHVENAAAAWEGYERASQGAVDRLTGKAAKPVAGMPERPKLTARLVAKPEAERPANQPSA